MSGISTEQTCKLFGGGVVIQWLELKSSGDVFPHIWGWCWLPSGLRARGPTLGFLMLFLHKGWFGITYSLVTGFLEQASQESKAKEHWHFVNYPCRPHNATGHSLLAEALTEVCPGSRGRDIDPTTQWGNGEVQEAMGQQTSLKPSLENTICHTVSHMDPFLIACHIHATSFPLRGGSLPGPAMALQLQATEASPG